MALDSLSGFFRYKLGRKLTLRIVLFSSVVTLFLTVVQFSFEFNQLSKKLDEVPNFIEKTMMPAIAESIWLDDRAQLQKLLQGINQLEFLDANKLALQDGERIEYIAGESNYSRSYLIEVTREGEHLGQLNLVVSVDVVFKHMLNQVYIILLKNGLKTAFVVFFILVLFRSMVGRHLLAMIAFMKSYPSAGDPHEILLLERTASEQPDELDELASAFNELHYRIQSESQKREAAEGQIIHLERVGTMGELATSLAHELNQPLAGILGYSDIASRLLNQPENKKEELRECLQKMGNEAERAAEIIKRTRAYVKREKPASETVDMLAVIKESIALIAHRGMQKNVGFTCLAQQSAKVDISKVQLQQVLVNLFNNAIQALSSGTSNVGQKKEIIVELHLSDQQVHLSVSDNGPGLSSEMKSQLFEAFRTTKADGLGLGLVICRNIIEAAQGGLTAENNSTGGARFTITLPRKDDLQQMKESK